MQGTQHLNIKLHDQFNVILISRLEAPKKKRKKLTTETGPQRITNACRYKHYHIQRFLKIDPKSLCRY